MDAAPSAASASAVVTASGRARIRSASGAEAEEGRSSKARWRRPGASAMHVRCVSDTQSLWTLSVSGFLDRELWPHLLKRPCLLSSCALEILARPVRASAHTSSRVHL